MRQDLCDLRFGMEESTLSKTESVMLRADQISFSVVAKVENVLSCCTWTVILRVSYFDHSVEVQDISRPLKMGPL